MPVEFPEIGALLDIIFEMLRRHLHEAFERMHARTGGERMGQVLCGKARLDQLGIAHALHVANAHEERLALSKPKASMISCLSRPSTLDCMSTTRWSFSQMRPSPSEKWMASVSSFSVGAAPSRVRDRPLAPSASPNPWMLPQARSGQAAAVSCLRLPRIHDFMNCFTL